MLNVVIYVPFGFFAVLAWPERQGLVLVAALAISVFVETMQLAFLDRIAATDDVVLNVTGAALGWFAGLVALRLAGRGDRARESG